MFHSGMHWLGGWNRVDTILTHGPRREVPGMNGLGGWSWVEMPWEGSGMAGNRMGGSVGVAPRGNESVFAIAALHVLNSNTVLKSNPNSKAQILG